MGKPRMSEDEWKRIASYLKAGYKYDEIAALTGRSHPSIKKVKDALAMEKQEAQTEIVEDSTKEESAVKTIADCDYAKARDSGDPRWKNDSLEISKGLYIHSKKTGLDYLMKEHDSCVTVKLNGKTLAEIPEKIFTEFVDEVFDVGIEVEKFRHK